MAYSAQQVSDLMARILSKNRATGTVSRGGQNFVLRLPGGQQTVISRANSPSRGSVRLR